METLLNFIKFPPLSCFILSTYLELAFMYFYDCDELNVCTKLYDADIKIFYDYSDLFKDAV